ncbi:MAG: hypothetical protein Q9205_004880, partial [Flavoplaca limonia]
AEELRLPCWVFHKYDPGSIATNDVLSIHQCPCKASSKESKNQEANISTVVDSLVASFVNVEAKSNLQLQLAFQAAFSTTSTHQASDNSAQIKDDPEPRDVSAFPVFWWI